MAQRIHPCGNLPITTFSATLWYCHHHQAWFWSSYVLREDGADEPTTLDSRSGELGPFDSREDALACAQRALAVSVAQYG